ncbi:hypothetical protein B0H15DRAFT_953417 [Mycena belliarum]|uniref:Uncharacterized protein n=1 Tax=Mycena belliarum TaxID=1033014 RepID=A0AAD6XKD1_9AGAR|nr:hypothetical protein B0H15DRAFT_953417 [Mycena belliae]
MPASSSHFPPSFCRIGTNTAPSNISTPLTLSWDIPGPDFELTLLASNSAPSRLVNATFKQPAVVAVLSHGMSAAQRSRPPDFGFCMRVGGVASRFRMQPQVGLLHSLDPLQVLIGSVGGRLPRAFLFPGAAPEVSFHFRGSREQVNMFAMHRSMYTRDLALIVTRPCPMIFYWPCATSQNLIRYSGFPRAACSPTGRAPLVTGLMRYQSCGGVGAQSCTIFDTSYAFADDAPAAPRRAAAAAATAAIISMCLTHSPFQCDLSRSHHRHKCDVLSIPLQRRRASMYTAFDALDTLSDVPALAQLNLAPDLMRLTRPGRRLID